jgi:hypothetical protein
MLMLLHMPATPQLALLLLLLLPLLLLAAALTAVVHLILRAKVLLLVPRQHHGLGSLQPCQLFAAGWIGLLCCLLALLQRVRQVRFQTDVITLNASTEFGLCDVPEGVGAQYAVECLLWRCCWGPVRH